MPREVVLAAPAKINVHLGIYPGRDARGYHRADSVMIALALEDEVSVVEVPDEGLSVDFDPPLDVPGEQTVVARAALRLAEAFDLPCDVRVFVRRRIPDKSGLGSSSTDAAAVLRALCRLWGVDPLGRRVIEVARGLGADVAFFLDARPTWLSGVGDVAERTFAQIADIPIVLVRPEAGVSTVEAYAEFDRATVEPAAASLMCAALEDGDVPGVAAALYNNLAPAAIALAPEIGEVRAWLRRQEGVLSAEVTGSGSCVFAVCATEAAAFGVAREAMRLGWWSCATATR